MIKSKIGVEDTSEQEKTNPDGFGLIPKSQLQKAIKNIEFYKGSKTFLQQTHWRHMMVLNFESAITDQLFSVFFVTDNWFKI